MVTDVLVAPGDQVDHRASARGPRTPGMTDPPPGVTPASRRTGQAVLDRIDGVRAPRGLDPAGGRAELAAAFAEVDRRRASGSDLPWPG